MLIQGCAIKTRQAVCIAWKVRRDPVQQHTDAGLMTAIHQKLQIVGRAMPAGGREIAGGLITPGVIERMFGDRQQLDVREVHLPQVTHQLHRQFAVVEEAAIGIASPGTQMHFINR